MSVVVNAKGLKKRYGDTLAVRGIDFQIARGECFSFLGPNGAGKSSTIRMLSCLSPVSAGTLEVLGIPVHVGELRIKQRLGIVAQEDQLDPDLDVMENLMIYARFFGLNQALAGERAAQLLTFLQLTEKRRSQVRELSGGMRRRLVIARSLMNQPDILILDEPTTGLDPQARLLVWSALAQLKAAGVTLVLTTHYMEEAQRLADRIVVLDHGVIIAQGTPGQLVADIVGAEAIEIWQPRHDDDAVLEIARPHLRRHDRHGDHLVLYSDAPGRLVELLRVASVLSSRAMVRPTNLEDVFLTLTGRDLRE